MKNQYPWRVDRWSSSVAVKRMTLEERGLYRELLDWQWQGNGYLPESLKEISTLVGVDVSDPRFQNVLKKFPVSGAGQRANAVLLAIWQDQHDAASCQVSSVAEPDVPSLIRTKRYTLEQCLASASVIGMAKPEAEAFFHYWNSIDWKKKGGQPIGNLASALQLWKINAPNFKAPTSAPSQRPQSPAAIAEKAVNEIVKELHDRPQAEHADYLLSCRDKYATMPKHEGFTVWEAARRYYKNSMQK